MSVPRGNVLNSQSVEQGFNCQFLSTHHRFKICHNEHKHYSNFRKVIATCPGMRGKHVAARILETIIFSTYYFYLWGGERRIRIPESDRLHPGYQNSLNRFRCADAPRSVPSVRRDSGDSDTALFRTWISFSFGANEVRRVEERGVCVAKHHCLTICR